VIVLRTAGDFHLLQSAKLIASMAGQSRRLRGQIIAG
jgi:hypothetical protein